jgi:hypothetical protein
MQAVGWVEPAIPIMTKPVMGIAALNQSYKSLPVTVGYVVSV